MNNENISNMALCITTVLTYRHYSDIEIPEPIKSDIQWILNRYEELRIIHPQGFIGAMLQAKTEWCAKKLIEFQQQT